MSGDKSRAGSEELRPLVMSFWVLAWGLFTLVGGVVFLIYKPFDWGSWGITYVGVGMIWLGLRGVRSEKKRLEELGDRNPLKKSDRQ
jgi:hypothetical protein